MEIDGRTIRYTATVGWMIMEDEDDEPVARFGYTAYTRDGGVKAAKRPVMFAFNGGPGSSSIWLHMGILGPRRVVVTDEGYTPPPPAERVNNAFSVLDVTDIVMVDPVGTGFSKPIGEGKGEDFWGVDQDIRSVGAFIKKYVKENGRWASPKYILGESYGGVRSAGLVYHLQSQHGMNFNGVIIVSPFLNMGSGIDGASIDLPHVLYLPTLAATAWYHDAIPDNPPVSKPSTRKSNALPTTNTPRRCSRATGFPPRKSRPSRQGLRRTPARRRTTGSRRTCGSATASSCRNSSGTSA